ncbi:putative MFS protein [Coleophoma crateriformis]|uniref:Putative MFS protein n=1 Tax=Coleophoma crateriformis TaxID=565419 RepID=A0A3D8RPJ1_9HELO|nr:putative MFS protein [Coleophoma crateriformis]
MTSPAPAIVADIPTDTEKMSASKPANADDIEIGSISPTKLDRTEEFLRDNDISHAQVHELVEDTEANKRLIRKVDMILMPLLMGTYVLQYIDKQALSYAAVFDLLTDTNMSGTQYANLTTFFYLGYLVAEYPWSYLAQKTNIAMVVGGCVMAWGTVLMLAAACTSYSGLAACRFFLGIFEAPITPCFMMIVGQWYLRSQQPFRAGLFYCCNGVGSMVGGVITYGIGRGLEHKSFPVWKVIFLLCGGCTFIWGIVIFLFMPADIMSSKRLNNTEKATLIGRGWSNQTGILNHSIKWYQIREALMDPQVWILFLYTFLNELINGGFANFGKLILKGVVHGSLQTTALAIPQGAFQVVFILSGTLMASKLKNFRTIVMAIYIIPTIIGVSLMWQLPRTNKYGNLLGYYITGSFVSALVVALQMPASNLGGYTKRVTGTAFVFLAYCLGNIIGPHAFLASEAPTYPTGCKLIIGCAVGQMFLACCLRLLLTRRNKKRDEAAAAAVAVTPGKEGVEEVYQDLTDFENPEFRYVF